MTPPLPTGSLFAEHFRVGEVLGVGGYGVVYRAVDERTGEVLALKAMRAGRLTHSGRERLRREALLLAGVEHPHLVRLLGAGESDGVAYLTMELVEGESLRSRMVRGALSIEESVRFAREILSGLSALHALGIVHRDVKPGNVLLDGEGRAKLADFGLVRRWDADATRATTSLAVVGTAEYLSPEQALGDELDGRSDLYSLGVVLFEMLSGHPVHERRSTFATVLAHLNQSARDVRELRAETPAWLAAVVERLLEKEPARRYESAAEALSDLELGRSPRGALRRRLMRWSVAAGAAAVLGVALAGWWSLEYGRSRFERVGFEGNASVLALDRVGRVLWRREGIATAGNFVPLRWSDGERRIAALLASPDKNTVEARHRLSLLDPQSGAEVESIQLPDAAIWAFSELSNRYFCRLQAFDLDGDGVDEIYASYRHETLWPSYVVTYDPALRQSGVVFVAAGHHRPVAAADVDGDGRRELLLLGAANRMGGYAALAAVRVVWTPGLTPGSAPELRPAGTPDSERLVEQDHNLAWYVLLPPAEFRRGETPIEVDEASRSLRVQYPDGGTAAVSFDGFRREDVVPELGSAERSAMRARAYETMRAAMRPPGGGSPAQAVQAAEAASSTAMAAGDPLLAEWADRLRVRALAASGATSEAEALAATLALRTSAGLGVALEAAQAFHLAGELERARAWYERGLTEAGRRAGAQRCWEYLEGEVLVLAELRRWDEIPVACRRVKQVDPSSFSRRSEIYEAWSRLRGGHEAQSPHQIGGALPLLEPLASALERALRFELELAAGGEAEPLLARVEADPGSASETAFLLTSIRGELLARLGRFDEARSAARLALADARHRSATEVTARAFLRDLAERAARFERLARSGNG